MQFELLPTDDATEGYLFGLKQGLHVESDGFDPGSLNWITQTQNNPTRGGRRFGRDLPEGKTWTWSAFVNATSTETALATLGQASTAWYAREVRQRHEQVMPLRYHVGGRTRRVYGRPAQFAAPPDNRIMGGMIPVTMSFETSDALHYDDMVSTTTLSLAALSDGGWVFPVTFPYQSLPVGSQSAQAV